MNTVIKEYAGTIIGLLGVVLSFSVLGELFFRAEGILGWLIQRGLEGGI